jgi:hypothetical protein
MPRFFLALAIITCVGPTSARADAFDHYVNTILSRAVEDKKLEKIDKITQDMMVEHARVLPGITAAFIVVRTNEGRWAKILLQPARQKISEKESVPIALLERFVAYREGEERTIHTSGDNIRLFHDFRFSLDIGQVVPPSVTADLRFVSEGDKQQLEPVGKAEMYLVSRPLPEATPKKTAKVVVGEKFETRYWSGVYKLYDDGRRSGSLHLKVDDRSEVTGYFYSDKDGSKYEVFGKVGTPNHTADFTITYPRTIQHFRAWMFTGDAKVLSGSSRLQERETGFYAIRVEE